MSKAEFSTTIYGKIFNKLDALEIGQTIKQDEMIIDLYGRIDEYVHNSFRVHFVKAKKYDVSKKYKSRCNLITRIQ